METELQEKVDHPLDPLVESEIETGVEILQSEADLSETSRIIKIVLKEPSKDTLQEYERGNQDVIEREANVIVRDSEERKTYEGVVSLDDETLTSWEHVPGVQPSITLEEFDESFLELLTQRLQSSRPERTAFHFLRRTMSGGSSVLGRIQSMLECILSMIFGPSCMLHV